MIVRLVSALIAFTWFALPAQAQAPDTQPAPPPGGDAIRDVAAIPASVRVERNVVYLPADRPEMADVYVPANLPADARLPAMVIIHGGGFNIGDKGNAREINIGSNLALHGIIGLSINYKLCKTAGEVTWPQNLGDAKTAVRWLRKNAARLHVDPARIGVWGSSAGGTLSMLVALTRPQDGLDPAEPYGDISCAVTCAIDFYGPADLLNHHDENMFDKTRAEAPDLYAKASPITYVHKDAPPILIVHGTADALVPTAQSRKLAALLEKAGANCKLAIIPGAPHMFDLQPVQRDLRPLVFQFLDEHLGSGDSNAK